MQIADVNLTIITAQSILPIFKNIYLIETDTKINIDINYISIKDDNGILNNALCIVIETLARDNHTKLLIRVLNIQKRSDNK